MRIYLEEDKIGKNEGKHYIDANLWSLGIVNFCAMLIWHIAIFGSFILIGILLAIINNVFFGY